MRDLVKKPAVTFFRAIVFFYSPHEKVGKVWEKNSPIINTPNRGLFLCRYFFYSHLSLVNECGKFWSEFMKNENTWISSGRRFRRAKRCSNSRSSLSLALFLCLPVYLYPVSLRCLSTLSLCLSMSNRLVPSSLELSLSLCFFLVCVCVDDARMRACMTAGAYAWMMTGAWMHRRMDGMLDIYPVYNKCSSTGFRSRTHRRCYRSCLMGCTRTWTGCWRNPTPNSRYEYKHCFPLVLKQKIHQAIKKKSPSPLYVFTLYWVPF